MVTHATNTMPAARINADLAGSSHSIPSWWCGGSPPLNGAKKWRTVTVFAITSLTVTPGPGAGWIRGHWRIEALHHGYSLGVRIGTNRASSRITLVES